MSNRRTFRESIKRALSERKKEHRFRSLKSLSPIPGTSRIEFNGKEYINFCSNDYLGLATHPEVIRRSKEFTARFGTGSGASRLVSGSLDIHQQLEEKLSTVLDLDAVLLFNSGFQANTTILSSIAGKRSLILADKKCHNSLIQGALLSRATFKRFRHNDYEHLENMLIESRSEGYDQIWVVSETVFSMDGDRSDSMKLVGLCEKYSVMLYLDDAHALGVLGENGLGLNYKREGIELSLGTFGKAFGAFGAFAGCSRDLKDYLINFCPGFIYTTALPPSVIGAVDAALDLIPSMDIQRTFLMENVAYLKEELAKADFETGVSNSQIIPIIIGTEEETVKLSVFLESHGFLASAIRPPTVEAGASRIRVTLTTNHTKEEVDQLIEVLKAWRNR
ncbi:MAG: 8-amino-7-oxononanoate synthase [Balneola sp.]|nr:MAG: 8-amino-7-oxononanoate synthase [Balneola sp.]